MNVLKEFVITHKNLQGVQKPRTVFINKRMCTSEKRARLKKRIYIYIIHIKFKVKDK